MLDIIWCRIFRLSVCYPKIHKDEDIQNYNIACCFVFVLNLVIHIEGRM